MQRHEYSSRKSEQNAKEKSDVSIMNVGFEFSLHAPSRRLIP